jgi:hypothetical protein
MPSATPIWPSTACPDELESKLEILWLIDRMAPPRTALLPRQPSNLSIADLASCTNRPEKVHRHRSFASGVCTAGTGAGPCASRRCRPQIKKPLTLVLLASSAC